MAGGAKAWRLFATVSAIGATLVARKAVVTAWSKATGNPPPTNPEADDTSLSQAIGWALLSGAAVGLARMYATKKCDLQR